MPGIQPHNPVEDDGLSEAEHRAHELNALVAQIGGTDAAIAALVNAIRAKRESELEIMRSRGEL